MLGKKWIRTALSYKAQFLSMILMIAIGMGIFFGFHAEWYSLKKDTDGFMEQCLYADYRLYDDAGFSEADIASVRAIDGVESATRFLSVNAGIKDREQALALTVVEDYVNTRMVVMKGESYDENSDGFYLSDRFAEANGLALGDSLTVTYRGIELSGKIVSLIKSAEYMVCVADSNQLMPDYRSFGFVYVSPQKLLTALGEVFYPQINVRSGLNQSEFAGSVEEALEKTTLILPKEQHTAYAAAQSEIEEGQTMGTILPCLFLAIGILTMMTTMHRITVNEKIQIGTLKALGFKRKRILSHYTSYGFFIGILGSLLAVGLGYGIAALVVNPNQFQGTYFDFPDWNLYFPLYSWLILIAMIVLLTFICFLSVKKMLKGTAADSLRPYVPKRVKPLRIEKTKLWNRFRFGTRWNLRDALRHKSRTTMSLIGVLGCTILLIGGLGMKDTMSDFIRLIDREIYVYETKVNFAETASQQETRAFIEAYDADFLAETTCELDGMSVAFDIYELNHDRIRFVDRNNRSVSLDDDGVYICLRLADTYSVGDTLRISPYGSDQTYEVRVAGIVRSFMNESVSMTSAYAEKQGIPFRISSAFLSQKAAEIEAADCISGMQSKQAVMDSYDSFMEIMDMMVLIFVLGAVLLGLIVLYNLGVMSYVERYRELATLKVVGFKNRKIGRLLIGQNLGLTLIGLLVGIPSGAGVLYLLLQTLAEEYELKMVIGGTTILFCTLLTVGVSFLVGFFIARKNRKIDMVEALKGGE